jgi:hypothetical protein
MNAQAITTTAGIYGLYLLSEKAPNLNYGTAHQFQDLKIFSSEV